MIPHQEQSTYGLPNSMYNQRGETFRQSLVTSHQLLASSHQLLLTSYQSLVAGQELLINTSYQLLVNNVSSQNDICQRYSREMFGGVLCLLVLKLFAKPNKDCLFKVSDTYVLIHVFQKQLRNAFLQNIEAATRDVLYKRVFL